MVHSALGDKITKSLKNEDQIAVRFFSGAEPQ